MTNSKVQSPDLLRRFVATPYVFTNDGGTDGLSIQSNDLEIALAVRRYWIDRSRKNEAAVASWKIIRDVIAPDNLAEIFILSDGKLRTLMRGTGTILFCDVERSELMGFISAKTTTNQLISSLIPALLTPLSL